MVDGFILYQFCHKKYHYSNSIAQTIVTSEVSKELAFHIYVLMYSLCISDCLK
jgi:hypothetical protein